jgi:phosphopantetheine adenylyltransferase
MADNKKLVVEVNVNKANASIKSINTGLSSMEQAAGKAARGAYAGIDGLTISMVKGSAAGNLLADSIRKALDWAKEWTLGAAQHAAHTDKMSLSMAALAKAHGVSAEASNRAVEAVKKVGFGTQDAIHRKRRGWRRSPRTPPPSKTSRPARRWRSCSWPSSRARRAGSGP